MGEVMRELRSVGDYLYCWFFPAETSDRV